MPNDCYNRLLITGDANEIKRFFEDNMVDGQLKLRFPTLAHETMTNSISTRVKNTDNGVTIDFLTDWRPPLDWLLFISGEYETLSFIMTYYELNMGFYGVVEAGQGSFVNKQFMTTGDDIRGHSDDEELGGVIGDAVEYGAGNFADIISITGMKYEASY